MWAIYHESLTSCWFQLIWKLCSSNLIISPNRRENKKYLKPPPSHKSLTWIVRPFPLERGSEFVRPFWVKIPLLFTTGLGGIPSAGWSLVIGWAPRGPVALSFVATKPSTRKSVKVDIEASLAIWGHHQQWVNLVGGAVIFLQRISTNYVGFGGMCFF